MLSKQNMQYELTKIDSYSRTFSFDSHIANFAVNASVFEYYRTLKCFS